MFDEFVAGSQKVWAHDRALTVGASECFGCIRANHYKKRAKELGYKQDETYEENWGAMRRGDIMENNLIVPACRQGLNRRGMDLIMEGDDQETIVDGYNSATLDGLIIPIDEALGGFLPSDFLEYYGIDPEEFGENQDSVVLEMKSFDPRITIMHEKAIHHGQTQMQMGLIRDTTEYKPNYAVVIYVNASWHDDIRPFVVRYDHDQYMSGRERNEKVFTENDPGRFPAEGKMDGDCKYCKFQEQCAKDSVARVPARQAPLSKTQVDKQDDSLVEELSDLTSALKVAKEEKKTVEKTVEELNEQIRMAMSKAGTSRAVGEGWKTFYSAQRGQKRLSAAKIEAAGLDPEDFKEEGAGFEKLTVTFDKD